jgi:hypothetical protein
MIYEFFTTRVKEPIGEYILGSKKADGSRDYIGTTMKFTPAAATPSLSLVRGA